MRNADASRHSGIYSRTKEGYRHRGLLRHVQRRSVAPIPVWFHDNLDILIKSHQKTQKSLDGFCVPNFAGDSICPGLSEGPMSGAAGPRSNVECAEAFPGALSVPENEA